MLSKWFSVLFVVAAIFALAAQPAAAVSNTVVISEFRTRGPNPTDPFDPLSRDSFIELYNLSASSVDIYGYTITVWDPVNGLYDVAQIGSFGTGPITLLPFQHYLITSGAYSGPPGDDGFFVPMQSDEVGIALFDNNGILIDTVSTSNDPLNPYIVGPTTLPPMTQDLDRSYERLPGTVSVSGGGHKNGIDTDNDLADFKYNDGTIGNVPSPEQWNNGSGPTAVVLRDLRVQAQSPAVWLPVAVLLVLGGTLLVSRRRRRA